MLFRRSVLTSLVVAALLSACASTPVPRGVRLIDAQRLSTLIRVDEPTTGRSATQTMKVAVAVRNTSPNTLMVEGRAIFRSDAATEPATGWKRVFIQKDSVETMEFSSLNERANDFVVELREGNR